MTRMLMDYDDYDDAELRDDDYDYDDAMDYDHSYCDDVAK